MPKLPNLTNPPPDQSRSTPLGAAWLDEAKFGMFIHWGLYSGLGRDEWVMHKEKIPVAQYRKHAQTFNPAKFDATRWVEIAKNAGMKYLTLTTKHHDGFCLFDSAVDDYNVVMGSPFQRDVVAELKTACDQAGLRFGVYYSHVQDWFHPGGTCNGPQWDPAQAGDLRTYLDTVAIPQIKELLTRYEPSHLWFDTPHGMTPELARELMAVIRDTKPDTLVNSRLIYHGYQIADLTPERLDELAELDVDFLSYRDREIPDSSPWEHWETCMTLNQSWGYMENDHAWKSSQKVIQQLVEVVSKGGAFLLNVGPTGEGEIPIPTINILGEVGDWLKLHGQAIYNAKPTALQGAGVFSSEPSAELAEQEKKAQQTGAGQAKEIIGEFKHHWLATGKERSIYIHFFEWPTTPFILEAFHGQAVSAHWLSDPQKTPLKLTQTQAGLSVTLPATPPCPLVPVLCLTVED